MTFTKEVNEALSAKLDPSVVKSRKQAGRDVSYIEGWKAIAEANRIFGFDGWTRETVDVRLVAERERKVGDGTGWGVSYVYRVRVAVGGVVREGVGAGHGIDRDLGQAHESAIKEAETDAMKRALMTFGWPFGLALYDKSQEHVEKPEPAAKAPAKAPPPSAPAAVSEFWQRPSYEIRCDDLLVFAGKFEKAVALCPSADALLKLEEDNKSDLAALNHGSPSVWKQIQTSLGAAREKHHQKAA